MRFLIDAQLPPSLARWLSNRGHSCDHVNDLGLGAATDDLIEALARKKGAVIWSKDADFAERARRAPGLRVVWLRFGNTSTDALHDRLAAQFSDIESALAGGEVLVEVR
ncbi:MAG: DUF5615 family PIN-like protein [Defluviicoccus sp.]|nr:DUF5615 family PIN-like protein [Defluviicoccus sp.]